MAQIQLYSFQMRLTYKLYIILMSNNNRKIKSKFTYKIKLTNLTYVYKIYQSFICTLE